MVRAVVRDEVVTNDEELAVEREPKGPFGPEPASMIRMPPVGPLKAF